MQRDPFTEKIIGCVIEFHRELGPGLLESIYQQCLAHEFHLNGISLLKNPKNTPTVLDSLVKTTSSSILICGRVKPGVFLKALPEAKQEMHGQHHVNHMKMPSWPRSMFIMAHTQMAFTFLKTFKVEKMPRISLNRGSRT